MGHCSEPVGWCLHSEIEPRVFELVLADHPSNGDASRMRTCELDLIHPGFLPASFRRDQDVRICRDGKLSGHLRLLCSLRKLRA